MNHSTTRTVFRTVAIAEAVSWAALLVAMLFKWVIQDDPHAGIEGGVPIAGLVHGVVFAIYLLTTLITAFIFRWSIRTTLIALAASIPPFFTYLFEVLADRRGLLGRPVNDTTP